MVSTAMIKRLAGEMDALEERYAPKRPFKVAHITFPMYCDEEAVEALHYKLHPEDVDPDVVIRTIYHSNDMEPGPDDKKNEAWRQLAREEMAALSPRALSDLWARRSIAAELKRVTRGGSGEHHFAASGVGQVVALYDFPETEAFALMRSVGMDPDSERVRSSFNQGKTVGGKKGTRICLTPMRH